MSDGFHLGLCVERRAKRAILCCAALALAGGFGAGARSARAQTAGGTPAVTVAPPSLSFQATPVGAISNAQVVTVTNSGTGTLNITGLELSGSRLPDFAFNSSCVLPLAPGGNCIININFAPLGPGARSAQLLINSDAPDAPQAIALTGEGSDPYALSVAGSNTASVKAGQTAVYNLQLTPLTGFFGSVQITCSGAPAGASCSASPATVALIVGGGAPVGFVVKVTTGGGGAAAATPPGNYSLAVTAVWGALSEKTSLNLVVQ